MATFVELVVFLRQNNIEYFVAGNGSNLLVSDAGFKGVVISLGKRFSEIVVDDDMIYAHAGALLSVVGRQALTEGLTGFEFASGIPGSVGGAVYMNAGAYKSDMGYIVQRVKVLTPDLKIIRLENREMDFHYRSSFLQRNKNI
jgi:UDP-N-acetylmuramate dehydrogenase